MGVRACGTHSACLRRLGGAFCEGAKMRLGLSRCPVRPDGFEPHADDMAPVLEGDVVLVQAAVDLLVGGLTATDTQERHDELHVV